MLQPERVLVLCNMKTKEHVRSTTSRSKFLSISRVSNRGFFWGHVRYTWEIHQGCRSEVESSSRYSPDGASKGSLTSKRRLWNRLRIQDLLAID
jgi:hypothetical protein